VCPGVPRGARGGGGDGEESVSSLKLTTSSGDESGLVRFFGMLEIVMRSVCRFRCAVNADADADACSEEERCLCCDDTVLADQQEQGRLEVSAAHQPAGCVIRSGEPKSRHTDR